MPSIKIPSGKWKCVECGITFQPSSKGDSEIQMLLNGMPQFPITAICANGHRVHPQCMEDKSYRSGRKCKICSSPVYVLSVQELYNLLP
jgi:hypothetical protein